MKISTCFITPKFSYEKSKTNPTKTYKSLNEGKNVANFSSVCYRPIFMGKFPQENIDRFLDFDELTSSIFSDRKKVNLEWIKNEQFQDYYTKKYLTNNDGTADNAKLLTIKKMQNPAKKDAAIAYLANSNYWRDRAISAQLLMEVTDKKLAQTLIKTLSIDDDKTVNEALVVSQIKMLKTPEQKDLAINNLAEDDMKLPMVVDLVDEISSEKLKSKIQKKLDTCNYFNLEDKLNTRKNLVGFDLDLSNEIKFVENLVPTKNLPIVEKLKIFGANKTSSEQEIKNWITHYDKFYEKALDKGLSLGYLYKNSDNFLELMRLDKRLLDKKLELDNKALDNFLKIYSNTRKRIFYKELVKQSKPLNAAQKEYMIEAAEIYSQLDEPERFFAHLEKMKTDKTIKFPEIKTEAELLPSLHDCMEIQRADYSKYFKEVLLSDVENNYENFLYDINKNKYANKNLSLKNTFEKKGLDINNWLNYDKKETHGAFEVELLKRRPLESIFLGNQVGTCIATNNFNAHRMLNSLMDISRQHIITKIDGKPQSYLRFELVVEKDKFFIKKETYEKSNNKNCPDNKKLLDDYLYDYLNATTSQDW